MDPKPSSSKAAISSSAINASVSKKAAKTESKPIVLPISPGFELMPTMNDQHLDRNQSSKNDDSNLVSMPASLSRDPLGLNDLQTTYSYSLDDGLHNFILPISSSSSQSNNFVVSGQNFNIAPSISLDKEKTKSYRLVSTTEKSSAKIPTKLSAIDKKAYEENVEYSCEWDDCGETFKSDLNPFLKHVSEHVHDIPIISTKVTAKSVKENGMTDLEESGQKTYGCLWQVFIHKIISNNILKITLEINCELKKRRLEKFVKFFAK